MHYGESLKALTNEEFGDGIMSAIDFYCDVEKMKGVGGEERVVITFNGKVSIGAIARASLACWERG